jgi:hypothetical protein
MSSRPAPTRGLTRRENPCKIELSEGSIAGVDTAGKMCNNAYSSPFRAPKIRVRHAV